MNDPTKRSLAEWQSDLDESEAQADAGQTVPLAPALDRIRGSIRELESKLPNGTRRKAALRR